MSDLITTTSVRRGGELQASIPSSTQNESVCKVSGIGGKHIIQRRLKSRRRTSQLCVSFPQFSGDHKTSQRSLQQMPLNQQCDHIEGESQLAITNGVRSTVIEEVPIAESNLEKKTPTQPKNACCTTHLNGSARCKQPHKRKPCIAVTERDNQRHSSALWHQPKVTRFMELSPVSPSPDPPKQGAKDGSVADVANSTYTPSRILRRNVRGETPLHIAAIKGNVDVVKDLLKQGASPNIGDNAGWTPLV
jgi:hypothetical protein